MDSVVTLGDAVAMPRVEPALRRAELTGDFTLREAPCGDLVLEEDQLLPEGETDTLEADPKRFARIVRRLKYKLGPETHAPPTEASDQTLPLNEEVIQLAPTHQVHLLHGLPSRGSTAEQAEQLLQHLVTQLNPHRVKSALEVVHRSRADNGGRNLRVGPHPGDGDFGRRFTQFCA